MGLSVRERWIVLIQVLLSLSIPVAIFSSTSCIEEPQPQMVELGLQVSDEELIVAIESVLAPLEAGKLLMQAGQMAHYELNQNIELSTTQKVSDHFQQILSRDETEDLVVYHVRNVDISYSGSSQDAEIVESESVWEFRQDSDLINTLNNLAPQLQTLALGEIVDRTYHNLSVQQNRLMGPPRAVGEREGCEGLTNCQILTTDLSYDQIDWYEDGSWYKTRHFYRFTSSLPYLARLISYCIYQQVPYGSRDYLISQCQVLRDFQL